MINSKLTLSVITSFALVSCLTGCEFTAENSSENANSNYTYQAQQEQVSDVDSTGVNSLVFIFNNGITDSFTWQDIGNFWGLQLSFLENGTWSTFYPINQSTQNYSFAGFVAIDKSWSTFYPINDSTQNYSFTARFFNSSISSVAVFVAGDIDKSWSTFYSVNYSTQNDSFAAEFFNSSVSSIYYIPIIPIPSNSPESIPEPEIDFYTFGIFGLGMLLSRKKL